MPDTADSGQSIKVCRAKQQRLRCNTEQRRKPGAAAPAWPPVLELDKALPKVQLAQHLLAQHFASLQLHLPHAGLAIEACRDSTHIVRPRLQRQQAAVGPNPTGTGSPDPQRFIGPLHMQMAPAMQPEAPPDCLPCMEACRAARLDLTRVEPGFSDKSSIDRLQLVAVAEQAG